MTGPAPLDVAAPSPFVDPLSPWVAPASGGDRALAAGFWAGFHGLSAFAHAAAVAALLAATLLPVPFLATTCATVKEVPKLDDRVEVALVAAPKPKPDEGLPALAMLTGGDGVAVRTCRVDEDCREHERCVAGACVLGERHDELAKTKKQKPPKKKHHRRTPRVDEGEIAMLVASDDNVAVLGALSSLDSGNAIADLVATGTGGVEGGIEGGVVGGSAGTGKVFGVGGLGLRGTGPGDDDAPQPQVLAPAPVATAPVRTLLLDRLDDRVRRHVERGLRRCPGVAALDGTVHAAAGGAITDVVTHPRDRCVEERLRALLDGLLPSGDTPFRFVVLDPPAGSPPVPQHG